MKSIVLSTFASAAMLLLLTWLPIHWLACGHWLYSRDSPRLKLPEASDENTRIYCVAGPCVSLDPAQGWTLAGSGNVTEDRLGAELNRRADAMRRHGYSPFLRVRIPADQSARHFLRLHKIANNAGIEDFAFATFTTPDR